MNKKLYQCSYCKISLRSEKEFKDHEEICIKNGKTEQERFNAKKQLKKARQFRLGRSG